MGRNKRELTQQLVEKFPVEMNMSWEALYPLWWYNLRGSGGMRLTKLGYETFIDHFKLEHYDVAVDPFEVTSKLILAMDRKLQMPYYIETKKKMPTKIIFFGSREAMMANLYGGVQKFIDSYQP